MDKLTDKQEKMAMRFQTLGNLRKNKALARQLKSEGKFPLSYYYFFWKKNWELRLRWLRPGPYIKELKVLEKHMKDRGW